MTPQTRRELFDRLKAILEEYKEHFAVSEAADRYTLNTRGPVTAFGREYDNMMFVGLKELKNIVGFYFMPIYIDPALKDQVPDSWKKILKGHTCFNVKTLTPEMEKDLRTLLKIGVRDYKKRKWV